MKKLTTTTRGGLLAVFAMAVLTGCGPATPSPTIAAAASPTASPAPSPTIAAYTDGARPGEVTVDPSLPDALPLPDGIWSQTAPGWVLATYRPSVATYSQSADEKLEVSMEATKQVVYLVSPKGARYQVLELDPSVTVTIDSWSAGETVAYVGLCEFSAPCLDEITGLSLDLTTGNVFAIDALFDLQEFSIVATTREGSRVWYSYETAETLLEVDGAFTSLGERWAVYEPRLSPRMDWIVLGQRPDYSQAHPDEAGDAIAVVEIATGDVVVAPVDDGEHSCGPWDWADDTHLTYKCLSSDTDGLTVHEYKLDVTTSASATVGSFPVHEEEPGQGDEPTMLSQLEVAPDVFVGEYYRAPGSTDADVYFSSWLGVEDHGTTTKIDLVDDSGAKVAPLDIRTALGGVVYVSALHPDTLGTGSLVVIAYDVLAGTQTILLPAPPGGLTVNAPVDPAHRTFGIASWVVAP